MFDRAKMTDIITAYKEYFPIHWKDEKYKWEAIKHFQENWDINALDFKTMLEISLSKTYNLLASGYYYAKAMIIQFAEEDPKATRTAFVNLFDESRDLTERIASFYAFAEDRKENYNDGWKNHYQSANAISTYLWLKYPNKYYIYKYSEYRSVSRELASDFVPKKGFSPEVLVDGYKMYDEICSLLKQDEELKGLLYSALTDSCYNDPEYRTLTIDFGFFISRFYSEKDENTGKTEEWWPSLEDYTPGFSSEDWIRLLKDPEIIGPVWGKSLAEYYDIGGTATCSQIGEKYNRNPSSVIGNLTNLAKHIYKKTQCKLYDAGDGRNRYWPILFQGKSAAADVAGNWIWKLRPELYDALKQVNIMKYISSFTDTHETEIYTKEDFLEEVYMPEDRYDTLVALLRNKKNIILQGAPGVGKTFTAKRLAYSMMGKKDDSRVEFIQFHQSYSYEDFIMGYKPVDDGFKLTNGVFYRFCQTADNHPEEDYYFIIDEINRGNLSKIFGELLMLIEKDYRGTKATLAYSDMPFSVPKNLYIIGMMNTADRSLALIDYALRRRFSFFDIEPGFTSEGFKEYQDSLHNETFDTLIDRVKELNRDIYADDSLGAGFRIGHSYFCGQSECSEEWMREIVYYDLIPMLQEYWFDDKQKLQKWENNLTGVFDD